MRIVQTLGVCLLTALLVGGCAKTYKITHELEQSLNSLHHCQLGQITDALPMDIESGDHPTSQQLAKLRGAIAKELIEKQFFATVSESKPDAEYEIIGTILDYKKGSRFLRFMIGFGAGSSKLTVELKLQDRSSRAVLFSGNFTQSVKSGAESGDLKYERVAKDFVKAIEKELERLRKQG